MIVDGVEVTALEYRPGDGLIIRCGLLDAKKLSTLGAAFDAVLRGSPSRIYWFCCDAAPDGPHDAACPMHGEEAE